MSIHDEARDEVDSLCHDPIRCRDCGEMTTRHDPCCVSVPCCECVDCPSCGELAPECEPGFCHECWTDRERADAAATAAQAYRDWRRS